MELFASLLSFASSVLDAALSTLLYYMVLRQARRAVPRGQLLFLLALNVVPTIVLSFTAVPYLYKSLLAFGIDVFTCFVLSGRRLGLSVCLPAAYFGLLFLCECTVPPTLAVFYPSVPYESVAFTSFIMVYGTLESRGLIYLLLGAAIYLVYRRKTFLETRHLRAPQWICLGSGLLLLGSFAAAFSYAQNNDPQWLHHIAPVVPVVLALFLVLFLLLLISLSRETERKYRLQGELLHAEQRLEQEKTLLSLYEQTRGMRHDFQNHMQVLKALAKQGKTDEINAYLSAIGETAAFAGGAWIDTGDATVNALLNAKLSRALQSGIRVRAEVCYPQPMHIPAADVCTALFNLLDNAIEACERNVQSENRRIRLDIRQEGGFFSISCVNPCEAEPARNERRGFFSSKGGPMHGIGLRQLEKLAQSHGGVFHAEYQNGQFTVKLMLPHPAAENLFASFADLPQGRSSTHTAP